ncbi:MAG: thioredoxin domain-containing protein [Candidatus Magasanikbacteria bacterium]
MPKTKTLILIFIPALLIAGFALFIRVIQYEPLYPKITNTLKNNGNNFTVPIYPEDPIIGNKKAPQTIIVFEDFACEGCNIQFTLLEQIMTKYPNKLKIIWKGLPVSQFPYSSELAHRYSLCANEQDKFTEFYKFAFTNGDNLSEEILNIINEQIDINPKKLATCLESGRADSHISKTEQLGMVLNIQAVPTIFINNKQVESPSTVEGWETLLNL